MKICFLSSKHSSLDKRIFAKEAVSLAKNGFEVLHIAPDKGVSEFVEDGVRIITYKQTHKMTARLLQIPRLYRIASNIDADCYHCNEVDSWIIGVLLKLIHQKQVVFDVHELYSDAFPRDHFPAWVYPYMSFMLRQFFRVFSCFTDRLVLANKALAVDFPETEKKQVLVQNFSSINDMRLKQVSKIRRNYNASQKMYTAIHLGHISRVRGWPQLLEALALMESKNICLLIVGSFNDDSQEEFERRVRQLGLYGRVFIEEWMPFPQALERILTSDFGLILFQPGLLSHVIGLPHKLFDYMLGGLPVIAPEFAQQIATIIENADCGILIDSSDSKQIAEALERLASDPKERERLGNNGRYAVLNEFNWETEALKLVSMYVELEKNLNK